MSLQWKRGDGKRIPQTVPVYMERRLLVVEKRMLTWASHPYPSSELSHSNVLDGILIVYRRAHKARTPLYGRACVQL